MTGKKEAIAKGEIIKMEHLSSDAIQDKYKNENFGFKCLHYSVSEAAGKLRIYITNKKNVATSVRVATVDAEAQAGDDFDAVDEIVVFKKGEAQKFVEVGIHDDESWEPDEDFFVVLYDPVTNEELKGQDCKSRVTIIDDDKPGQISFKEEKTIKAIASENNAEIVIVRKNGADGRVTVDYETVQIDATAHSATQGLDYEHTQGTLVFEAQETIKSINVKILDRKDVDERDETFGIQLSSITPEGAKLSKKSFQNVNIITDVEGKKKEEALKQLLEKIEAEEEQSWKGQFITACMLHPSKDEDGNINNITNLEVFMHFSCIGWKLLFSIIPPPHYLGGWACFGCSLALIGAVTFVIGEFANMFGCVLGIPPAITAITFVALGTSLPDTFASMVAATQDKYADSAVSNVTGSNSVNVLLGLGLPWVIACMWESSTSAEDKKYTTDSYFVPAKTLGFSVIVFVIVATMGICILLIRRKIVGGELGGSSTGRTVSAVMFVTLWLIYVIMSILQSTGIGGIDKQSWGIKVEALNPNPLCN